MFKFRTFDKKSLKIGRKYTKSATEKSVEMKLCDRVPKYQFWKKGTGKLFWKIRNRMGKITLNIYRFKLSRIVERCFYPRAKILKYETTER